MAYLALYRKFRPIDFKGLIGQEHIVKILTGQVISGKIGHAYLFCGSRGTGKTSAAKIFARAVNCLQDREGSPCNECEVCKALSGGNSLDILEIDAASNNKVEEVRELRENVQYPPVNGKYKVYIIDEVHMLTDSAFNALLKTLEEPPAHAIFILATTEVHKLPATILSRCMRFDFRLVALPVLEKHLKFVMDSIGKPYEERALREIARNAEGSVRDMLSIADMCVSLSPDTLTYGDVLGVLSASDSAGITALGKSIIEGDIKDALLRIDGLCQSGKNVAVLNKDLTLFFRDLMVLKSAGDSALPLLSVPDETLQAYRQISDGANMAMLLRCVELFSAQDSVIRHSLYPRIALESAVLKAARPSMDSRPEAAEYKSDELLFRIEKLNAQLNSLAAVSPALSAGQITEKDLIKNNGAAAGEPARCKRADGEMAESGTPPAVTFSGETDNSQDAHTAADKSGAVNTGTVQNISAAYKPKTTDREHDAVTLSKVADGGVYKGITALQEQYYEDAPFPDDSGAPLQEQYYNYTPFQEDSGAPLDDEGVAAKPNTNTAEMQQSGGGFGSTEALKKLEQSVGNTEAAVIWGAVIRELRQSRSGMLYTLCRDLRTDIRHGAFVICAPDNMCCEILKKPKNIDELTRLVTAGAGGRNYKVIVELCDAEAGGGADSLGDDDALRQLKELAGDKLIIK